jgi:hypothetical protein
VFTWSSNILFFKFSFNSTLGYRPVSSSAKKHIDLSPEGQVPDDNTRYDATNSAVCWSVQGVPVPTQHPQSTSNTHKFLEASAFQTIHFRVPIRVCFAFSVQVRSNPPPPRIHRLRTRSVFPDIIKMLASKLFNRHLIPNLTEYHGTEVRTRFL